MIAHIDSCETDPFVLAGYAGTGKTTAVTTALRNRSGVVFTAPTHKAVGVLSSMGLIPGCAYRTLHSLLGCRRQRVNGESKFCPQWDKAVWEDYGIIVIDEVSMVGDEIWSWVLEAQTRWPRTLICMGDPCQLPPVNDGDESPAFEHTSVQLTEVMRHAGPILEIATRVRENLTAPRPIEAPAFRVDQETFLARFVQCVLNDDDCKALAWTNRAVAWLNSEIRRRVFGDPPDIWQEGEHVVVKTTWSSPDEQVLLHSEQDLWLTSSAEPVKHLDVPAWRVEVDGIDRPLYTVAPDGEKVFRSEASRLKHEARSHGAWRDYYAFTDAFCDLRLGYATTVHKSQGSTYEHCYVVDSNLKKCPDVRTRNMLRYVAFSRASDYLVIS